MANVARKLRPGKVARALTRRWFERQLQRTPLHGGVEVSELGSSYGGWIVPTELIQPKWVCYSVGAGGDVSFDLELIDRFGVTLRSVEAVPELAEAARRAGEGRSGFTVTTAALSVADGPLQMQVTHDPASRSVSPSGLYESTRFVELHGRSMASLMHEFADDAIDLLKLDIEGGEYDLLPRLSLGELGVKVFAVQLHHNRGVAAARSLLHELARQGYVPIGCRPAVKLTFVHRDQLDSSIQRGSLR